MAEIKDIQLSFFRGGITNVKNPETVSLEWALNHIREGVEYDPHIRELRMVTDKERQNELKRKVSYFIFSGTFSRRHLEGLIQHSGLIILDFDEVKDILNTRIQIQSDPFALAVFKSIRGNGLKVLVRIDPARHLDSFNALERYYARNYGLLLDPSGKDVCRACYTSVDESLYFNPDAAVFTPELASLDPITGEIIEDLPSIAQGKADAKKRVAKKVIPAPAQQRRHMSDEDYLDLVAGRVIARNLDLTSTYESWQLLAFSMATFGEIGRQYFHALSQFHAEYNEKEADKKFDNALKSKRFTNPRWFYAEAKKHGVDITWPKEEAQIEPTKTTAKPKTKTTEVPEDGTALEITWGNQIHWKTREEEADAERSIRRYRHCEYKNSIFMATFKLEEGVARVTLKQATNFSLNPLYLVMDDEGKASRIIEITNEVNETMLVLIPTEAFTSVQEFSKFVERGNYFHAMTKAEFNHLKKRVYALCKPARLIASLGHQPEGFFAFANGIFDGKEFKKINEYGVVEHADRHYFLPAMSAMFRDQVKNYQFEREFVYVQRQVSFEDWAMLFVQVYGENGIVALAWQVAALFSDLIYKVDGCFSLLYLYGKPESGKSTLGSSQLALFHANYEKLGVNINNISNPALGRKLNQISNGLVLIEEYQNEVEKYKVEALKQIWDRRPFSKSDTNASNTSNKTVGITPESPAVITSQHLPNQDVALFTRTVLLSFFKKDSFTEEEQNRMRELKELQSGSLTQIITQIIRHRADMEKNFADIFHTEKKKLNGTFYGAHVNRVAQHCAHLFATYKSLEKSLRWPYSFAQLEEVTLKMATRQVDMMVSSEENSTFWDVVQGLIFSQQLHHDTDYAIRTLSSLSVVPMNEKKEVVVELGESQKVIYIRLPRVHGLYLTQMRLQGRKNPMDKTSLTNYLQNSRQFIGTKKSFRFKDAVTSAFVFNYTMMEEAGITLERLEGDTAMSETELMAITDNTPTTAAGLPPALKNDDEVPF